MPHYRAVGDIPPKRHLRSGGFEELVGEEGFSGASSLLYHRASPSALLAVEEVEGPRPALVANHPLSPKHLQLSKLAETADPVTGRQVLAGTPSCTLAWWAGGAATSPLYRDATGDTLAYVQSGQLRLDTAFGALDLHAGDYAVVPAGAVHRFAGTGPASMLLVEAHGGHIDIPARYLTARGQLREGAPFSERDIRAPVAPTTPERGPADVLVRTRAGLTRHVMAHHPFDVVGWDGCAYPWAIDILAMEPVVGRIHQPPPVHQTFEGPRLVVCSFVPRPYDFEPGALKIPYHHANVDSDEVLFYSRGEFMSRAGAGIAATSMTVHPAGYTHGPQPGALERSADQDGTEEVAVMIDTFDPLSFGAPAAQVEDDTYWGELGQVTATGYPELSTCDGRPSVALDADHPGFADSVYRARRDAIAARALGWAPGLDVPDIDYTAGEDATWAAVRAGLRPLWDVRAAGVFIEGVDALGLPADRVPQLSEVSAALRRARGGAAGSFCYQPVAGLAPLRQFYLAFGSGVFWSTQYIRHGSRPLYTPEPDICHEVLGHAHQLADPGLAGVYRAVAAATARVETDAGLRFLSRVFWRTMEFGVVREAGGIRAYGAGLLSSVGELRALGGARLLDVDWADMGTRGYDITRYQAEVYCAPSPEWIVTELPAWLDAYDDDVCARLAVVGASS